MASMSPAQVRAARAFLGWSMFDLAAEANISISTIKRYEDGRGAPSSADMIQRALENQGISFLEDDGTGAGLRYTSRLNADKSPSATKRDALSQSVALAV